MAAWSTLVRSAVQNLPKNRIFLTKLPLRNVIINQNPSHMSSTMVITASRWQWHKTKDLFHFYFMVAAIPLTIITFCVNVFVGPATLTPIPEGYEPKYWEYFNHPISRFLARRIFNNPQKDYEKNLAALWQESQIIKIRKLEERVWQLQSERQDYRYNYFLPYDNFATKEFREIVQHDLDEMD